MGRYVARRLLQLIPVILGTTFFIYALVWALPTDPFAGRCGIRPCTDAYIAAKTAEFNLNDPLIVQYVKWLGNVLTGDLGSTIAGQDVADLIARAFPITVKLTLVAIFFEIIIGISAGVLSALRRNGFVDNLVLVTTLIIISIPVFVLGRVAQYVFGVQLGWFPISVSSGAPWGDLILPGLVLAALSLAYVARLMRAELAETLRADYVRTAVSKGLPQRTVVSRHAVRNSLIPVITFIGADFGVLLGGAIVTEGIFNIQGVGGLTYRAIQNQEGALVVTIVTLLVLVFLIVNLLVDLLYARLDPRIRYE
jgi:oligopeptide transport system permease protein